MPLARFLVSPEGRIGKSGGTSGASLPSPAWMQVALYSWRSDCHSMGTRPAGPGTG
ncbi:MAG: hypothetical protein WA395_04205 [Nitrososphaeraceae archaeon]